MDASQLKDVSLFEGMDEAELAECASAFQQERVLMGDRLTHKEDYGYSFFVVLSGRVRVDVDGTTVAELSAGQHFGEVSLVRGEKRNATVVALEGCELAKIMAWDFKQLLADHPTLAQRLKASAEERS